MNMSEFYEFIGRLAYLLYADAIPLAKKIERLLQYLLPLVNFKFNPVELDEEIPSESDYDQD